MLPSYPFLATGGSGSSVGPGDPIGGGGQSDSDTVVVYAPGADSLDAGGNASDDPGAAGDPIPCRVKDLRATRRVAGFDPHGIAIFEVRSAVSLGVTEDGQRIDWIGNLRGTFPEPYKLRSNGEEIAPNSAEPDDYLVYATFRD